MTANPYFFVLNEHLLLIKFVMIDKKYTKRYHLYDI